MSRLVAFTWNWSIHDESCGLYLEDINLEKWNVKRIGRILSVTGIGVSFSPDLRCKVT